MATPKTKTTAAPVEEATPEVVTHPERKTIFISKIPGQRDQDDVIISVNGERFQIKRGVPVSVPIRVARAFELWQRECEEAERIEFELMDE